ncbi:hypothetical protein PAMP_018591 [Pampus punctatissimus]
MPAEDHPLFWVAGMKVLHWCILGVTTLLLVCEITISQLCNSIITLVVSFHTLFILMCMLFDPQTANIKRSQPPSLDLPASPPHASSSSAALPSTIEPSPVLQTASHESSIPFKPATPQPNHEAASVINSHELISPNISPPALPCGLSYTDSRSEAFGAFSSVLIMASLCMSYILEIISVATEPQPVRRPVLLVAIGAISLLHKMLMLGLNWDQLKGKRGWDAREPETKCHIEVNYNAMTEEGSQTEPRQVLDDISQVQPAVDNSLHNGTLVLCNPGACSISDSISQAPEQQQEEHVDLKTCKPESHLNDIREISKDSTCVGHLDTSDLSQKAVCQSTHHTESPVPSRRWPVCLLLFVFVIQDLSVSVLGLINSLVMLLVRPHCLYSNGPCSLLLYLDPCLSLLGVMVLLTIAMPQIRKYGLLLLQGAPPHICVSDVEQKIVSVPGVQGVHDLHIWQLNDSLNVASVHVHCHTGFPAHRCADLISGVTEVLQSVGVSCCTVQPEFPVSSVTPAGSQGDAAPVVNTEDTSLPPVLTCSLACGKACVGSMCCSPLEETKTEEEPDKTLVIQNTMTDSVSEIILKEKK